MTRAGDDTLPSIVYQDLWHSCALWEREAGLPRLLRVLARVLLITRVRVAIWFRLSTWCFDRPAIRWMAYLLQARILKVSGAELHPAARIGPGLNLAHTGGIVIGRHVEVGNDLLIFQGTTLGDNGTDKGQPRLGDRIRLGAGAKVLGAVRIGDDVTVAANAVVVRDVAAHTVVAGVPAKVLTSPEQRA